MSKWEKFLAGAAVTAAGAFALNYLGCRSRKGWYVEPGRPDECLPPAIRSGLKAGIFNALKVPPLMQLGIETLVSQANTPTREPDLIDDVTGQPYWVRLPEEPGDEWWRYLNVPS